MADDKLSGLGWAGERVMVNVRRIREIQRLTYAAVAERLKTLNRPIPVLGLRRIERGERRVDVDDLVVLGLALGVPPIALLLPAGSDQTVEILPGLPVHVATAISWFAGNGDALPVSADEFNERFGRGGLDADSGLHEWYDVPWPALTRPLDLLRNHAKHVFRWHEAIATARLLAKDQASFDEILFRLRQDIAGDLRAIRAEMRQTGMEPPDLPAELAAEGIDATTPKKRGVKK